MLFCARDTVRGFASRAGRMWCSAVLACVVLKGVWAFVAKPPCLLFTVHSSAFLSVQGRFQKIWCVCSVRLCALGHGRCSKIF